VKYILNVQHTLVTALKIICPSVTGGLVETGAEWNNICMILTTYRMKINIGSMVSINDMGPFPPPPKPHAYTLFQGRAVA
jgi:hypothetical protein